jgi:hypothetical protein
MTLPEAIGLVRLMIDRGIPRAEAIENPAIPRGLREEISETLAREDNITLEPARMILAETNRDEWLRQVDRSAWYYWPTLREYLLGTKNWPSTVVRSLDEITDRILGQLAPPTEERFDVRGLVLGFVQSGKTANYTALAAKAADVGYRLIIVLSGIDNGLRRQSQLRLKRELVGYIDNRPGVVRLPPLGQQWHEFTTDDINGDFRPGFANHAALQGSQPVLLVVKKNGPVLRRLLRWLDEAPDEVRRTIPLLMIDDEADQASVDTRGSYQTEDQELPDEYVGPTVINGRIRELLHKFQRRAYVAYTATPFANILIPHDTFDPQVANDLYPKDFIVDLPKPDGYFGAEELFGRLDPSGEDVTGLDIIRDVPDEDLRVLDEGLIPESLETALIDFVLAGAARAQRGQGDLPATMLLHVSRLVIDQQRIAANIRLRFSEFRDEWRYQRQHGIRDRLQQRWDAEFRPLTHTMRRSDESSFEVIEQHIGPFFEAVAQNVREINSATGEVLDYEREPSLKAIAVGGNRLSRGLTLEGLLVSYFVRRSGMYDTLMQMGRWFGFRGRYEDLTRIYTTAELSGWFSDLAFVEHRLRQDIKVYEEQGLTPYQVGMRIWQHPAMQVTSPLKRRFSSSTTISQSYSFALEQTFKFPLRRPEDLASQAEGNLQTTREFLSVIGAPRPEKKGPVWLNVQAEAIVDFLHRFQLDTEARSISIPLICSYIERQVELGELIHWTVAVRGRESRDRQLGEADWGRFSDPIFQVSRTRIQETDSLGVITDPDDESVGLSLDAVERMNRFLEEGKKSGHAAREARSPEEGLLMLYPISRNSGYKLRAGQRDIRRPLYENPDDSRARDLIGLAISFPRSRQPQQVMAYLEGSVGWRPVE